MKALKEYANTVSPITQKLKNNNENENLEATIVANKNSQLLEKFTNFNNKA